MYNERQGCLRPLSFLLAITGRNMPESCTASCGNVCEAVFQYVRVSVVIQGGTVVEWALVPTFHDPAPHTFQLQIGRTGTSTADDWTNVGATAQDTFYLVDDTQRVFGQTQWTHYRVKLVTSLGTYYSQPASCYGGLDVRDNRLVREIQRQWRVRYQATHAGCRGYLLKRKLYGAACSAGHIDYQTGENLNPDCPLCFGTGFEGGYFAATPCIWAELSQKVRREQVQEPTATTNNIVISGKFLSVPQLDTEDVWVQDESDMRWFIQSIKHVAEYRGVPVIVEAELRHAPFSHTIYGLAIDRT